MPWAARAIASACRAARRNAGSSRFLDYNVLGHTRGRIPIHCCVSSSLRTCSSGVPAAATQSPQCEVNSAYKSSPRHDMVMIYTCTKCNTRSAKTCSRQTYDTGVVIVRCGGCNNHHLIADRLGMFGEKGSVEDFLAEKGEMVKRASEGTYEFSLEDFVGKSSSSS